MTESTYVRPPEPLTDHTKELEKHVAAYSRMFDRRAQLQRDKERKQQEVEKLRQEQAEMDKQIENALIAIKNCLGPEDKTK
jgi:seryl-tRNA synthetase